VSELVDRMEFTEVTRSKFYGKPFRWGTCDCARIAASHARRFGWKVPTTGKYRSYRTAKQALQKLGVATIPELVAATGLHEISPAFAMTGDIVSFASDADIGAIGIVIGGGNMLAFHESAEGAAIISMVNIDKAWSVYNG
jgi:hypothetical protein